MLSLDMTRSFGWVSACVRVGEEFEFPYISMILPCSFSSHRGTQSWPLGNQIRHYIGFAPLEADGDPHFCGCLCPRSLQAKAPARKKIYICFGKGFFNVEVI